MSRDEKVMTLLSRSALSTSITELLLLPKFDNSDPSVTQDKEICPLRRSTQWNPFNVYLLSRFDVSSCFMTGDTLIFKLVILLALSNSKLMFIFLTLGKLKLTLFVLFYCFGHVTVILLSLGNTCHKKQSKPPSLIKIQESGVGSGTFQIIFNE